MSEDSQRVFVVDFGSRRTKLSTLGIENIMIDTVFGLYKDRIKKISIENGSVILRGLNGSDIFILGNVDSDEAPYYLYKDYSCDKIFKAVRYTLENEDESPFFFGGKGKYNEQDPDLIYTSFKNTLFLDNLIKPSDDRRYDIHNNTMYRKFKLNDCEFYVPDQLAAKYFLSYVIQFMFKYCGSNKTPLCYVFSYPDVGRYRQGYEEMIKSILKAYHSDYEEIIKKILFSTEPASSGVNVYKSRTQDGEVEKNNVIIVDIGGYTFSIAGFRADCGASNIDSLEVTCKPCSFSELGGDFINRKIVEFVKKEERKQIETSTAERIKMRFFGSESSKNGTYIVGDISISEGKLREFIEREVLEKYYEKIDESIRNIPDKFQGADNSIFFTGGTSSMSILIDYMRKKFADRSEVIDDSAFFHVCQGSVELPSEIKFRFEGSSGWIEGNSFYDIFSDSVKVECHNSFIQGEKPLTSYEIRVKESPVYNYNKFLYKPIFDGKFITRFEKYRSEGQVIDESTA